MGMLITESSLIIAAYGILSLTALLGILAIWTGRGLNQKYLYWLVVASLVLLTAGLVIRGLASGRLPVASLYEFVLLFVWGLLLVFVVAATRYRTVEFTILAALVALVLLSVGSTFPSEARPLMPALQSGWLHLHVATAVIAYGAFGVSFCLGLIYLLYPEADMSQEGSLRTLDRLLYQLVAGGLFFMTLVIITGAVWAEEVWGSWWSWDPKETWALITWLVYAAYLHARQTRGWRGRKAGVMAVVGFIIVLFTLFGVSTLLPGIHSYV